MKNYRFYNEIKEHIMWLESNKKKGRQLILENEDLSFLSISDVNLSESIFKNCNLQRAVFKNVILNMSYLSNNNLSYTKFLNSKFNNSVVKKNIFEGATLELIDSKQTTFINNRFRGVTFKNIKFDEAYFELNSFITCDFKNIKFSNLYSVHDKSQYCTYEAIEYIESYLKSSQISESSFYDCCLNNSYINVDESNNIYFKTQPEQFFINYKNSYTEKYLDRLVDTLLNKFQNFENLITNFKVKNNDEHEFSKLYIEFINYSLTMDQIKYQILILEDQGDTYIDQLLLMKTKISYLEPVIENRINMLSGLENENEEDE